MTPGICEVACGLSLADIARSNMLSPLPSLGSRDGLPSDLNPNKYRKGLGPNFHNFSQKTSHVVMGRGWHSTEPANTARMVKDCGTSAASNRTRVTAKATDRLDSCQRCRCCCCCPVFDAVTSPRSCTPHQTARQSGRHTRRSSALWNQGHTAPPPTPSVRSCPSASARRRRWRAKHGDFGRRPDS